MAFIILDVIDKILWYLSGLCVLAHTVLDINSLTIDKYFEILWKSMRAISSPSSFWRNESLVM